MQKISCTAKNINQEIMRKTNNQIANENSRSLSLNVYEIEMRGFSPSYHN